MKKRVIILLLAAMLIQADTIESKECNFVYAAETEEDAFVIEDGILTDGSKAEGKITIPDTVTKISKGAFKNNDKITEVTIPSSVTVIESEAFSGCTKLTTVSMKNSVKILGEKAFSDCINLKNIRLSEKLEKIEAFAFENCKSIKFFTIPESVKEIGENIFKNCKSLYKITTKGNFKFTTGIYDFLFNEEFMNGSQLAALYVVNKENAEELSETAKKTFKYPLDIIELGLNKTDIVMYIGDTNTLSMNGNTKCSSWESNNSSVASVNYYGKITAKSSGTAVITATVYGEEYTCNVTVKEKTSEYNDFVIKNGVLFEYNGTEENLVIPDTVTDFHWATLKGNPYTKTITIPGTVKRVYGFFDRFENLEKVIIKDGTEEVSGFAYCSNLKSVSLPDSVKKIGQSAFDGCIMLNSITLPNKLTHIGNSAFQNCDKLKRIDIPNTVESIEMMAFFNCKNLEDINIPEQVKFIGSYAFSKTKWIENKQKESPFVVVNGILIDAEKCTGNVKIPETVTEIGENAFTNASVKSVEIPSSVTKIDCEAFFGCTSLETVSMKNSVTEIGGEAFSWCTALKNIRLSNKLQTIEDGAFEYCHKLTNITIPASLKSMGDNVFFDCNRINIITVPNTEISNFYYGNKDTVLYVVKKDSTNKIQKKAKELNRTIKELALTDKSLSLKKGSTYELRMNSNAKCDYWKSSNPSVASVNYYGKITAKKAGTTIITTEIYGKKYTCKVTVK